MTILISDGENLLMDKVTLLEYKPGDYNLKQPAKGPLGGHYENRSKLHLVDPNASATIWGRRIKFYTGIGTIDYTWDKVIANGAIDIKSIFESNLYWNFLSKEMRLIVVDEDDTLSQIYYGWSERQWFATESTMAKYREGVLTIEGYNSEEVRSFQRTNNVQLTPLEAMVFAQTTTDQLGRRFDHYHIPSGKVQYDVDLSDRQRGMIIDGIERRMQLSRNFDSVYLLNTPDGK